MCTRRVRPKRPSDSLRPTSAVLETTFWCQQAKRDFVAKSTVATKICARFHKKDDTHNRRVMNAVWRRRKVTRLPTHTYESRTVYTMIPQIVRGFTLHQQHDSMTAFAGRL